MFGGVQSDNPNNYSNAVYEWNFDSNTFNKLDGKGILSFTIQC